MFIFPPCKTLSIASFVSRSKNTAHLPVYRTKDATQLTWSKGLNTYKKYSNGKTQWRHGGSCNTHSGSCNGMVLNFKLSVHWYKQDIKIDHLVRKIASVMRLTAVKQEKFIVKRGVVVMKPRTNSYLSRTQTWFRLSKEYSMSTWEEEWESLRLYMMLTTFLFVFYGVTFYSYCLHFENGNKIILGITHQNHYVNSNERWL